MSGGNLHDISSAFEERYDVLCERCECSKRNGKRFLRSSCCTVLVSTWNGRREVVNWARRIGSEKLTEYQYIEGYGRCL